MSKVIKIESVKETNLYKELKERNNEDTKGFVSNIIDLCDEASDRATQIPKFFSEYTLHNKTHFLRVTEIMSYVLGDTLKELNDIEIGLLILSAFYHDQGMFINDKEFQKLEGQDEFIVFRDNWILDHPNYKEIEKQLDFSSTQKGEKQRLLKVLNELNSALLTEFLRKTHGQRSSDYILSELSKDRALKVSGTNVSEILAKICLSHVKSIDWVVEDSGLNYDDDVGIYSVNSIFLCLVLRLADILDFDSDRTPDVLFKSIHFTNSVSISEWQKHINVSGWKISNKMVRYTMKFNHPAYEKTARKFLDWIDEELVNCHSLIKKTPKEFSKYKIPIADKVDRSRIGPKSNSYIFHDLEFNLSRDEIVKLLMTDKLYGNKSLFIRELLQNSLDALRLRKALYAMGGFDWSKGEVSFRHYLDENNEEVIECSDNGVGMDEYAISKFLGKVGRSYYRSPEFERLRSKLKEKGIDFEPCSQFGIGFMSCFMVGDRIEILTRKDYGNGKKIGKPLIIEINGLGGLLVIKEGVKDQEVGTKLRVFNKNKPLFYDRLSDRILLTQILKGYALGTEFPVTGICEIKGIEDKVVIPVEIDKKETFLESLKLEKIDTYETNLSEFNSDLRGYLRQSFLVDDNGLPTIKNTEAKWIVADDPSFKDGSSKIFLRTEKNNTLNSFSRFDFFSSTICLDGILVCGQPGRSHHDRMDLFALGQRATKINTEHFLTLDVRGKLKPELNPAREPLDNGALNTPFGWRKLRRTINQFSGVIWGDVIKLSDKGLKPKTFWELIIVYEGDVLEMNLNLLFKYLFLPINENDWIKLSEIDSFEFEKDDFKVKDRNGVICNINFPKSIQEFASTHHNGNGKNLSYMIKNLLFNFTEVVLNNGKIELALSRYIKENIHESNNKIPFINFDAQVITTSQVSDILNFNHPLVKIAFESQYVNNKNDLQEFASSFLSNINRLIEELNRDGKPISIDYKSRSLKFSSALYKKVDWERYSDELRPPYKIYVDENSTIEIDKDRFDYWLS